MVTLLTLISLGLALYYFHDRYKGATDVTRTDGDGTAVEAAAIMIEMLSRAESRITVLDYRKHPSQALHGSGDVIRAIDAAERTNPYLEIELATASAHRTPLAERIAAMPGGRTALGALDAGTKELMIQADDGRLSYHVPEIGKARRCVDGGAVGATEQLPGPAARLDHQLEDALDRAEPVVELGRARHAEIRHAGQRGPPAYRLERQVDDVAEGLPAGIHRRARRERPGDRHAHDDTVHPSRQHHNTPTWPAGNTPVEPTSALQGVISPVHRSTR